MTSILSSISGYFSKSLILGAFLPVAIFIVLATLFLVPLFPPDLATFAFLEGIDKQWKVVAISFIAVVASGLLYNLNIPILRMYEGYPWKKSSIGRKLTSRQRVSFDEAQYRTEATRVVLRFLRATVAKLPSTSSLMQEVLDSLQTLGSARSQSRLEDRRWQKVWQTWSKKDQFSDVKEQWEAIESELMARFSSYRQEIKTAYPDRKALILPTRLGNVIRSFEYYSDREYGIDSIAMWPRLVAVIPEEYAVSIDDAKTSFDFMMNCSALSVLLAGLILLAGLLFPAQLASTSPLISWAVKIGAFVSVSYLFYILSINRAGAWGSLVKGAFDLYRWDLFKKLGYKQEPVSREAERTLWGEISRQMIYGDRFDKKLQAYADAAPPSYPAVYGEPDLKLEVTRGVLTDLASEAVTVCLRIENTDPCSDVTNIIVTDKVSDDFEYQWESAKAQGSKIAVTGTNPYRFKIGNLSRGTDALLTYQVVPKKPQRASLSIEMKKNQTQRKNDRAESEQTEGGTGPRGSSGPPPAKESFTVLLDRGSAVELLNALVINLGGAFTSQGGDSTTESDS